MISQSRKQQHHESHRKKIGDYNVLDATPFMEMIKTVDKKQPTAAALEQKYKSSTCQI